MFKYIDYFSEKKSVNFFITVDDLKKNHLKRVRHLKIKKYVTNKFPFLKKLKFTHQKRIFCRRLQS